MASTAVFLLLLLALVVAVSVDALREKVPCVENGKFYRNPNRDPNLVWSAQECSKYYLCIEAEVFHFECSTGKFPTATMELMM